MQCQECQDMRGISRYILIEIQVAMMIFVCEAAPLHICQKRCKEGQIFLSSLWIRDGIHGT